MNTRSVLQSLGIVAGLGLCLALSRPATPGPAPHPLSSAADTYTIDPVHSSVTFRVKHLGVSYSFGRFDEIAGSFTLDAEKAENSKVSVEVKTGSVDTGNGKRDAHLKSPDFFDAKQFPTATFTSTSVKSAGDKKYSVTGDLALHGVTKPITIEMELVGRGEGMRGEQLAGVFGTVTLKRSDFGINYMPDGLGDDVLLTVSFEGDKK
jgi:polyisoprenoid-binding protein YceI